jgi:hypothetical protein
MARRIWYIYGQVKSGDVTSVIAPDELGGQMEMTSKSNMEQAIMAENESKYHQASQTPFMLPPLVNNFGYLGIGPHSDSVLQGEYHVPPKVDMYTTKFIQHLMMEP